MEVTVPDLNRRWEAALETHRTALAAAEQSRRDSVDAIARDAEPGERGTLTYEYGEVERTAQSAAGEDLRGAQGSLEAEFQQLREDLTAAAKSAGEALAAAVVADVRPGATSYESTATAATGLPGLTLVRDRDHNRQMVADAARVADEIEAFVNAEPGQAPLSDEAVAIMAANADDPVFAAALLHRLGPETAARLPHRITQDYPVRMGDADRGTPEYRELEASARQRNRALSPPSARRWPRRPPLAGSTNRGCGTTCRWPARAGMSA